MNGLHHFHIVAPYLINNVGASFSLPRCLVRMQGFLRSLPFGMWAGSPGARSFIWDDTRRLGDMTYVPLLVGIC